jgi:hypothetical protein
MSEMIDGEMLLHRTDQSSLTEHHNASVTNERV